MTKQTPKVTFLRHTKEITFSYKTAQDLRSITTIKPGAQIIVYKFNPQDPFIVAITKFKSLNYENTVHIYDLRSMKELYTLETGEIKDIKWNQAGANLNITYTKQVEVPNFFIRHTMQIKYFVDQVQIFTATKPAALITVKQQQAQKVMLALEQADKVAKQQRQAGWRRWTIVGCATLFVATALLLRK
jgi:hypothetical protein